MRAVRRKAILGKKDSGYVLLVALMVLVVLMTAALLVAMSLRHQSWLYRQELQNVELTARVDAGLALALSRLWTDPDFAGASEPFEGSRLDIEAKPIDEDHVEVTVKTTYWGGARAIRAAVLIDRELPSDPPRVLSWEPVVYRSGEDDAGIEVF